MTAPCQPRSSETPSPSACKCGANLTALDTRRSCSTRPRWTLRQHVWLRLTFRITALSSEAVRASSCSQTRRQQLSSHRNLNTERRTDIPTFITIGYGDQAGYDRTHPTVRERAHAHHKQRSTKLAPLLASVPSGSASTSPTSARPPAPAVRTELPHLPRVENLNLCRGAGRR